MVCLYYVLFFLIRWSAIATHLPKRTDNEIKNYWNTHLKKRLTKMGIDPITHKPKNDTLVSNDGQSKTAANLSHMAQWESARLEAEARLVRESKIRSHSIHNHQLGNSHHLFASSSSNNKNKEEDEQTLLFTPPSMVSSSHSLDVFKVWNNNNNNGGWLRASNDQGNNLESPTSTLSFNENVPPTMTSDGVGGANNNINDHNENANNNNENENVVSMIEFVGTNSSSCETGVVKEEGGDDHHDIQWKGYENSLTFTSNLHELTMSMEGELSLHHGGVVGDDVIAEEGFTNLLLKTNSEDLSLSDSGGESNTGDGDGRSGSEFYEDNNNYWNSILNLVNSSPSHSPMF